jgi:hypothetical protein
MWDAAKHPRGAHGHFGSAGAKRSVKAVKPKPKPPRGSDAARAPRVVFESVQREGGKAKRYDKAAARTEFLSSRSARRYVYR